MHCDDLADKCKDLEAELAQAKVKLAQHEVCGVCAGQQSVACGKWLVRARVCVCAGRPCDIVCTHVTASTSSQQASFSGRSCCICHFHTVHSLAFHALVRCASAPNEM